MNLKKITTIILALGFSLCVTKTFAAESVVAKPKLTEAQAGKLALKKVPNGKLGEGELEMENGILVYSFDISLPDSKSIVEVQVNAVTGSIVDVAVEGPAEQAKEAAADKKAEAGEKGEKGEKAEGKEKE
ncbi:MAG: PepSY domain-containing protein [Limisphaerales bacterium]